VHRARVGLGVDVDQRGLEEHLEHEEEAQRQADQPGVGRLRPACADPLHEPAPEHRRQEHGPAVGGQNQDQRLGDQVRVRGLHAGHL
jgi:hypothetical protein